MDATRNLGALLFVTGAGQAYGALASAAGRAGVEQTAIEAIERATLASLAKGMEKGMDKGIDTAETLADAEAGTAFGAAVDQLATWFAEARRG